MVMHDTIFPAWALSTEETLSTLETSRDGLSEKEAALRLRHFGPNSLPRQRRFTVLGLLGKQFVSPLIFILCAAAILTILLHEWVETIVIILAIFVNALLGFYQEYRAENAIEKLATYVRERARVRRGGVEQEIDSTLLVPGDIIRVGYGERIPADARLLEATNISVDEAVLTGESLPVAKDTATLSEGSSVADRTNMIHAGTLVVEGSAIAIVAATDSMTEIGRIAELVSTTHDAQTPLQKALNNIAWLLFGIIILLAIAILLLGLSRGAPLFDMLLMAAAITVGAVPEALPIALTVILAVGVERLARRKGIMRNLAATETLGSATVVMTDKTGTLTEANMRLVEVLPVAALLGGSASTHDEREILVSALADPDVTIQNPHEKPGLWQLAGKPFAIGVVRAALERDINPLPFLEERMSPLLPFNSTNKFSLLHGKDATVVLGAPEILIQRSRLEKDEYVRIEKMIHQTSAEGKRLLGVARLPASRAHSVGPEDVTDIEFLGILVFKDPIRHDAREAVKRIQELGARMIMLTGDLKGTAIAIAHEIGWHVTEGEVLTGEEFRALSDAELRDALRRVKIFARVTPEDKLRIGTLLRDAGEVVAMTGDGVNDAPSLKAVDIGVALGSGTDVAKATADLILLDDNFKTIVSAIEEGRRILENIRKVFVYLVSTSLSEVFLIGGALFFGLPLPLTALQIIWVNFFSDSLPALSFAFDQHFSERKEKRGTEAVFSREVKALTFGLGAMTSVFLFAMYAFLLKYVDATEAKSALFLCFSLSVLVISFSLRSLRASILSYNPFSNRYLNASVALGFVLTLATALVPPLERLFHVTTPSLPLWGLVVFWLILNIAILEFVKWLVRRMSA